MSSEQVTNNKPGKFPCKETERASNNLAQRKTIKIKIIVKKMKIVLFILL